MPMLKGPSPNPVQAPSLSMTNAIEVIPGQLYWASLSSMPSNTAKSHYFSIDDELIYEPFCSDFGPLNISMICRYIKKLDDMLRSPALANKRIIHVCAQDMKKRTNAACLICAYRVVAMGHAAQAATAPFEGIDPPLLPFRDASSGQCTFNLTIEDCMEALQISIEKQWFNWERFNVESYDYFSRVDKGDMNWVIPGKFLAFARPSPTKIDADGFPSFTPEDYGPVFKQAGIGLAVRLNKPSYDRRRFVDQGIRHIDLYFRDGSCPPAVLISKFLHATESEMGAVAVHCTAGLGRTGTLIGLYAMKHHFFPARAFIAWNRICRPGSVIGPQQQFLLGMEGEMFRAGLVARGPGRCPQLRPDTTDQDLARQMGGLSTRAKCKGEEYEDVGQGERLCSAKRNKQAAEQTD